MSEDWRTNKCPCGRPIYPKWQTCFPCRKKALGSLAEKPKRKPVYGK